jgi:hypothetical protein
LGWFGLLVGGGFRYFNAMHKSGPQSSSRLELPSAAELAAWLEKRGPVERPALASVPFICADNLGFFLFLKCAWLAFTLRVIGSP